MLLGSRKLMFKSFVKNCMFILLNQYYPEAKDEVEDIIPSERKAKSASDHDFSLNYSSFESERTLVSLRKLFVMVMKLDLIRKEADTLGLTSRADGFRNPIMQIILDELTYNSSYLSPFLLAFVEGKWKLEIILQYFSKYCGKGPDHTRRRSDNSQEDLKLESVLSFFLTATSANAIVKKMGAEIAQLLLTHVYQVRNPKDFYCSLKGVPSAESSRSVQGLGKGVSGEPYPRLCNARRPPLEPGTFQSQAVCLSVQDVTSNSTATSEKIGATLQEISSNFISAFQNIRKASPNIQMSPFEKEALFTAATLIRKLKSEER